MPHNLVDFFPDVLPKESIEDVLKWEVTSLYKIQNRKFDIAINLDKDEEVCQLLAHVDAKENMGLFGRTITFLQLQKKQLIN